jgi:hypothetical protein
MLWRASESLYSLINSSREGMCSESRCKIAFNRLSTAWLSPFSFAICITLLTCENALSISPVSVQESAKAKFSLKWVLSSSKRWSAVFSASSSRPAFRFNWKIAS